MDVDPPEPSGHLQSGDGAAARHDDYAKQLLRPEGQQFLREQFDHARLAYDVEEVPARGGAFPAWQFTAAPDRQSGEDSLRSVGRVRPPRGDEAAYAAVVELAFRGTTSYENWLTNLTFELEPSAVGDGRGSVHKGFQKAYLCLQEQVLQMAAKGLDALGASIGGSVLVLVAGHSLGGALAMLCAYDLAVTHKCAVRCCTWGSPRLGDREFASAYAENVKTTARFINKFDPVPRIPPDPDDGAFGNDADVLHWMLGAVLRRPQSALGGAGYCHVCHGEQLDDGLTSSLRHWAGVATIAGRAYSARGSSTNYRAQDPALDVLVPHKLKVYRQAMEDRIAAGDSVRATAQAQQAAAQAQQAASALWGQTATVASAAGKFLWSIRKPEPAQEHGHAVRRFYNGRAISGRAKIANLSEPGAGLF